MEGEARSAVSQPRVSRDARGEDITGRQKVLCVLYCDVSIVLYCTVECTVDRMNGERWRKRR